MGQSGIKKDAFAISGQNSNLANGAAGVVNPLYTQMATNPMGYTPQQKANMRTAADQGAGGAVSGIVGQGNLMAARTNNAGGTAAVADDAAREAIARSAQTNLDIENADANLAEKNKLVGLSGLNSLYDTGTGASVNALNVATRVQQPFWQQAALAGIQGASKMGAAAVGG